MWIGLRCDIFVAVEQAGKRSEPFVGKARAHYLSGIGPTLGRQQLEQLEVPSRFRYREDLPHYICSTVASSARRNMKRP